MKNQTREKNQKIHQKVVQRPDVNGTEFSFEESDAEVDDKNEKAKRATKNAGLAAKSRQFETISDKIAQDKFFNRNYVWPGSKNAFPFHVKLQTVGKYYPYAQGGPLFVDEVATKDDIARFAEKKLAMEKLGHRYLIIKEGMTLIDAMEALA